MSLVSMSTHHVHYCVCVLAVDGANSSICFSDGRMNGPVHHGATKEDSFITVCESVVI